MDRTYNVGADTNPISIEVGCGTAATCYTAAWQVFPGGQRTLKAESTKQGNGAIKKTALGKAGDLKNTKLIVQTIADFSALPKAIIDAIKNDPHALKVNLKIEYAFGGGTAGNQVFDYDYDDYTMGSDGKIVVVTKNIQLTP